MLRGAAIRAAAGRGRWHLVAGPTGAGKTTLARKLAEGNGGVVFSIDEWMNSLYWMDCLEKNDFPWAMERISRCEAQIASVAVELARAGVDAVLDLGFTLREHRADWLKRGREAGLAVELQLADAPVEERWGRVNERNRGASRTYTFEVTREMFDFMEQRWEQPDEAEWAGFGARL